MEYTTFDLNAVTASAPEAAGLVALRATLTNTGAKAGTAVVRVYVAPPAGTVPRPPKELNGFAKVTFVWVRRAVTINLGARAFAYFDAKAGQWRVDPGAFTVVAGFSARDLRGQVTVQPVARMLQL